MSKGNGGNRGNFMASLRRAPDFQGSTTSRVSGARPQKANKPKHMKPFNQNDKKEG